MDGFQFKFFAYESATARLKVMNGHLWVVSVFARDRGKGHATGLLKEITSWADERGEVLFLSVGSANPRKHPNILTDEQLISMYQRHGFEMLDSAKRAMPVMRRLPR